jgi:hypothetical protein
MVENRENFAVFTEQPGWCPAIQMNIVKYDVTTGLDAAASFMVKSSNRQ